MLEWYRDVGREGGGVRGGVVLGEDGGVGESDARERVGSCFGEGFSDKVRCCGHTKIKKNR